MAGRGSRFAGYLLPKPLIELEAGHPMIEYILDFLDIDEPHETIFVVRREHERDFAISHRLRGFVPNAKFVFIDHDTLGPADSALRAAKEVLADDEVVVAYCDQFLGVSFAAFLSHARRRHADGALLLCPSSIPTESYAVVDDRGEVLRTAEKQVISHLATTGFYYFRRARDLFDAAEGATEKWRPGDPELFVSPLYNDLIAKGLTVTSMPIKVNERFDAGTPERRTDVVRRLAQREIARVGSSGESSDRG